MIELKANLNSNKAYAREVEKQNILKPYILMFYKSPEEFINKRYSAQELYEKSKVFCKENGLRQPYSIQEFGQDISKLIGKYKKRTSSGYIYELCMDINEFNKLLSEYKIDKNIVVNIIKGVVQPNVQKPYIQMFYKSPEEFINKRYSAKELYDKSKLFALDNGSDNSYSVQEFGQGITRLIGKYKKRTSSGYIYELCMDINEFNKLLTEYDQEGK